MSLNEVKAAASARADLLTGLAAIADHLGWTERQVKHQAASGHIPTFKVGAFVCARPSSLAKHFASLDRDAQKQREGR